MLFSPLPPIVTPWVLMSMGISSETIIANGMGSPITMTSFPSMKTIEPEWVSEQPEIPRSQIIILATNETDVLVAIPDVIVRNHYGPRFDHPRRRRGRHKHWRRGRTQNRCQPPLSIWVNDTTGNQHHPPRRNQQHTRTQTFH